MSLSRQNRTLVFVVASSMLACGQDAAPGGAGVDAGSDGSRAGSGGSAGRGAGGSTAVVGGSSGRSGAGAGGSQAGAGNGGTDPGDGSSDAAGDAARTCSGTCAAFCANVVAQNCSDPDPTLHDRSACEARCSEPLPLVPAECECSFKNFYECAATARLECPNLGCNDSGICKDESPRVLGCAEEGRAFNACAGPCLHAGNTSGGSSPGSDGGPASSYEYTSTGCQCPPLETGLSPGSSCATATECAAFCCGCPSDRGKFVGRLCLDGRCAGSTAGCDHATNRTFGICRGVTP